MSIYTTDPHAERLDWAAETLGLHGSIDDLSRWTARLDAAGAGEVVDAWRTALRAALDADLTVDDYIWTTEYLYVTAGTEAPGTAAAAITRAVAAARRAASNAAAADHALAA